MFSIVPIMTCVVFLTMMLMTAGLVVACIVHLVKDVLNEKKEEKALKETKEN